MSGAALYEALEATLAAGHPAASVTIVRGPGIGRKLLVLPDGTRGSLGSDALDARAVGVAAALLDAEKSETRKPCLRHASICGKSSFTCTSVAWPVRQRRVCHRPSAAHRSAARHGY